VMRQAVLLGGWAAMRRTRHLRAVCLGEMRQCSVVVEEGGGATDGVGVVGHGQQQLRGTQGCGRRCCRGRGGSAMDDVEVVGRGVGGECGNATGGVIGGRR
jgi:hypothetical protein